jgi:hypothetical protein
MTSWVTYARPFAKSRKFYREKAEKYVRRADKAYEEGDIRYSSQMEEYWHKNLFAKEAIEHMWYAFRNKVINK